MDLTAWWEGGDHLALDLGGQARSVFVRRMGHGPPLTLFHGFPSSSHDWAKVAPALAERHTLIAPDFLGFGASDKPADHVYSLHEQADLVQAVWAELGVTETAALAHDYGVSVLQELFARDAPITAAHFLNGGLYPDLHHPEPVQVALRDPVQGPQISAAINEEIFGAALAATFADGYDHDADAQAIWRATERGDGHRISHLLIGYIADRQEHEERWVGALEGTGVPRAFTWGMVDPVSGGHVMPRLRERFPSAPITQLDDVGHWPQLEAPERVIAAVLA